VSNTLEHATLVEFIRRCAWLIEYYDRADDSREFVIELRSTMEHAIHELETTAPPTSTLAR
jgi:hypothetical protein